MSGFEYDHVLILRKIIICLLDNFIKGYEISNVVNNCKYAITKKVPKVTSTPTLFNCDLFKWQTRFPSALKTQRTRIHSTDQKQAKKFGCLHFY